MEKVICCIPARLNSSRFPRKILAKVYGKTLLEIVWQQARSVSLFDQVIIAVDSEEVFEIATKFGAEVIMTPENLQSGTERIAHLVKNDMIDGNIFVNWQADEPLVSEKMIETLLSETSGEDVWTLMRSLDAKDLNNSNVVKVVCDNKMRALYFSRRTIPFKRNLKSAEGLFMHIGLYAYSANFLRSIDFKRPCFLAEEESLEQLRFLYDGFRIGMRHVEAKTYGIDTRDDLERVRLLIPMPLGSNNGE